jgi:hypothetical protein
VQAGQGPPRRTTIERDGAPGAAPLPGPRPWPHRAIASSSSCVPVFLTSASPSEFPAPSSCPPWISRLNQSLFSLSTARSERLLGAARAASGPLRLPVRRGGRRGDRPRVQSVVLVRRSLRPGVTVTLPLSATGSGSDRDSDGRSDSDSEW